MIMSQYAHFAGAGAPGGPPQLNLSNKPDSLASKTPIAILGLALTTLGIGVGLFFAFKAGAFSSSHMWTLLGTGGVALAAAIVAYRIYYSLARKGDEDDETTSEERIRQFVKKHSFKTGVISYALLGIAALIVAGTLFQWPVLHPIGNFFKEEWKSITAVCGGAVALMCVVEMTRRCCIRVKSSSEAVAQRSQPVPPAVPASMPHPSAPPGGPSPPPYQEPEEI